MQTAPRPDNSLGTEPSDVKQFRGSDAAGLGSSFKDVFDALSRQIEFVIRGKRRAIHLALVCMFAEGHLLVEDVPGVGKTSLAKAIARSVGGTWRRIQFTPDLLPSDVTGVSVWNRSRGDFEFRPGRRSSPTSCSPTRSTGRRRRPSRRCSRRWKSSR